MTEAHLQKNKNRANISVVSAAAAEVKGTRFSVLLSNDNGPNISPPIKHKFSYSVTTAQLDRFTNEERKVEVTRIKENIQALKEEKKEKKKENQDAKRVKLAETKEKGFQEAVKRVKHQDEETKHDQDEASDSELGRQWEMVKRPLKR